MGSVKQDRIKLTAAERRKKAVDLRKAGATYDAIAQALQVTAKTARNDVQQALRDIPRESAEELRTIELQTLMTMQRAVWPALVTGQLGAVDRMIKIVQERAKPTGIYAPQRVDVGAADVDLDEVADRLHKQMQAGGEG